MDYEYIRTKIPLQMQSRIYYKSARTCAVCKTNNKPIQIHHIDQNRENNTEGNLILLCNNCHDEAHTKHQLSQNLTQDRLFFCKSEWENEVRLKSVEAMTSSNKLSPLNWTYFNFSIIPNYIISLGIDYKTNKYEYLLKKKIISKELEIININIEPRQKGHLMNTLFDNMEMQDALMLKSYYQELVNLMIAIVVPYELDAIWRRKYIKNLLTPNSFIYFMNGMYFKSIAEKNGIETKRVYMHSKGIKIQGYTYSNYMFGNSSQLNFFTGHSYISGFYLVKNVSNNLSYLNIDVTPIALGTGSWEYQTKTPYMLRNKMS